MSLPEISRRCLACGAAGRPGARFCPQCGHHLGAEGAAAGGEAAREAHAVEEAPAPREEPRPAPPPAPATRETAAHTFDAAGRETQRGAADDGAAVSGGAHADAALASGVAPPTPGPGLGDAGGAGLEAGGAAGFEGGGGAGRSRRAAARVKETVMPRVEKMRDEALVRIEETPDDSGLRFVLISVVLFGLFLLFLLLSTTVLR